ncbi:hypothetical protein TrST_g3624 [Triparma strigata]|uniref:Uncharacterized protein n=1 Tax=Triparma strigata TaxID=1606541 RepID=A0A9W7EQ81_9STRA|nr:hypothetical protein TrST_g3624 [Triparma strigata]
MADEGFVQPGYDLDIFEYRLGLRKETLQRRGRNIRKAAKEQKSMGASKLFGTAVEASVEKKREDAGGPRFHLAAAAAGLGGGGERVQFGARKKFGEALDRLGFAKGNFSFDGSLKSVIDDFRLTEETFDEERAAKGSLKGRIGKGVIGKGGVGEGLIGKGGLGEGIRRGATAAGGERKIPKPFKYGRELPFIYANLVKNIALIFTFGGALSFLAERFEEKVKERGAQVIKTDAQGILFRCIVLVVICNVGFFGAAAIIAGINVEEGEAGGGPWTSLFLAGMVLSLTSHFAVLNSGSGWRDVIGRVWAPAPWKGCRGRRGGRTRRREDGGEAEADSVVAVAVGSPMQVPPEGGDQGTGTGKGEAEGGENGIEMSKM